LNPENVDFGAAGSAFHRPWLLVQTKAAPEASSLLSRFFK
jgi:hypothetical protein